MNGYFCSIGENLASEIEDPPNPLLAGDSVVNKKNSRFKFKYISTLDIRDAIAKLTTAKSFGNDTISNYFLKLALPSIETSSTIMLNTSRETIQFPTLGKLARKNPIFKGLIGQKIQATILYLYCQSYQGYLKRWLPTSFTSSCMKIVCSRLINLDFGAIIKLNMLAPKYRWLLQWTRPRQASRNRPLILSTMMFFAKNLNYYGIQRRELLWFQFYLSNRQRYWSQWDWCGNQ